MYNRILSRRFMSLVSRNIIKFLVILQTKELLTLENVSCRSSVTQKNETIDEIRTEGCEAIENNSWRNLRNRTSQLRGYRV